jgi:CHAD domain-containing protein
MPATIGELAIGVLQQQTNVFLEHSPGARAGQDPRPVHQMRVAARRMRAALRLFRDLLPPDRVDHLNAELKWVAGQLGHVRDLDVQLRRLHDTATELQLETALEPYIAWLNDERHKAVEALQSALNSARFMDLVEALHGVSTWTLPETANALLHQDVPPRLKRVFKAFRKRARRLRPKDPSDAFHRVRIRAKRLRYATEFFAPLYGKPAQKFIKRLTRVQDVLGELQDSAVAAEHIKDAVNRQVGWPPETTLALGRLLEHNARRAARLKRQFPDRYKEVAGKAWRRLESNVVMS